jgi:hypothetical protein
MLSLPVERGRSVDMREYELVPPTFDGGVRHRCHVDRVILRQQASGP